MLEESLEIYPKNAFALRVLGDVFRMQAESLQLFENEKKEKLTSAQLKLKASLEIDPQNAFARGRLGNLFRVQSYTLQLFEDEKKEKLTLAQEELEAALKIEPQNAFNLSKLGTDWNRSYNYWWSNIGMGSRWSR